MDMFRKELKRLQEEQGEETTQQERPTQERPAGPADNQEPQGEGRILPELYDEILAYNTSIFENGQADLKDAWSYEQPVFRLEHYGLSSDMFGIITIPAMNLELPPYLGASWENLGKGAAILGQTSIPIGQENTNCVIAGHRGYKGKLFFCEIDAISVGDRVQIEHPWGKQQWEVFEIEIISPDDVEAIRIREGETLLTLITCHPYALNYNRYVVYCRPVTGEQETEGPSETKEQETERPSGTVEEAPSNQQGESSPPERQEELTKETEYDLTGERWGYIQRRLEKVLFAAGLALIVWALVLLFSRKRR